MRSRTRIAIGSAAMILALAVSCSSLVLSGCAGPSVPAPEAASCPGDSTEVEATYDEKLIKLAREMRVKWIAEPAPPGRLQICLADGTRCVDAEEFFAQYRK